MKPSSASLKGAFVILLCATIACAGPTAADEAACPQTYEFGNYGCADLHGQVLDSLDQAVAGVVVGAGNGGFNTMGTTTDLDGRFRLRLTLFFPIVGDTASVLVRAADPRTVPLGGQVPRVRDSVVAVARVAPLGKVPVPTQVRLKLQLRP